MVIQHLPASEESPGLLFDLGTFGTGVRGAAGIAGGGGAVLELLVHGGAEAAAPVEPLALAAAPVVQPELT